MKNHHCPFFHVTQVFFFLESIFPGIIAIHWAGYFNGHSIMVTHVCHRKKL